MNHIPLLLRQCCLALEKYRLDPGFRVDGLRRADWRVFRNAIHRRAYYAACACQMFTCGAAP